MSQELINELNKLKAIYQLRAIMFAIHDKTPLASAKGEKK